MEAHLWHTRGNALLPNNCFVNKAVARKFRHAYDCIGVLEPFGFQRVECDGRDQGFSGIALIGGFDGPIVTLLPAAVHTPRFDDIYQRERRKVYLRR